MKQSYHDKFTNNKNYQNESIDEDPIGESTDETDPNFPKQTNEEVYDDEGQNENDEQEDNDSQSEYYEAMGAGIDQITKSMPNVPVYNQVR